ncbi:MAG TPA: ferrous iron transport protein A [Clostridia bacterium]|nr:ferrous iron transport protein A [Clostridia bacterium]
MDLIDLKAGQSGRVKRIEGGRALIQRLEALGIRPGRIVKKMSSVFRRGPVTISLGSFEVALGYGMARRIIVEPVEGAVKRCD